VSNGGASRPFFEKKLPKSLAYSKNVIHLQGKKLKTK
jgi:hypothetical protein